MASKLIEIAKKQHQIKNELAKTTLTPAKRKSLMDERKQLVKKKIAIMKALKFVMEKLALGQD